MTLVATLIAASPTALAADLSYSGRLTQPNGAPLQGPVDLEVRFFTDATGNTQLGPTLSFTGKVLNQGVFQVVMTLTPAQIETIFDNPTAPWIEVRVDGKERPRQQFSAVPYAQRVPTGESLSWGTDGKLGVDVGKLDLSAVQGPVAISNDDGGSVTWKAADGATTDIELTLPTALGTNGQVLKTTAAGVLYWDNDDTMGGGSGTFGTMTADDHVRLKFDDATYVTVKAPDTAGTNYTLTLPPTAGSNNQVLTTNGSGVLSWTTPTTYAAVSHNHDAAYSAISHNHDAAYSAITHNHDAAYAPISHTHGSADIDAYADLSAAGKIGTGAAQVAAGNHSHTASDVGLGNVQNTNVLNSFTQNNSQYLATDEVRARDAGGLVLNDDGGNGMIVEDGGNVGIGIADPAAKLHVANGSILVTTVDNGIGPSPTDGVVPRGVLWDGNGTLVRDTGDMLFMMDTNNDNINMSYRFLVDGATRGSPGTELLRIQDDGKVGIGSMIPASRLDVAGDIRLGTTADACVSGKAGSARYSSSGATLEACVSNDGGTTWAWSPVVRQITSNLTMTVADPALTGGDDCLLVQSKLDLLKGVRIIPPAIVTVQLPDGTYNCASTIRVEHPDGPRLQIFGNMTTPASVDLIFTDADGIHVENQTRLGRLGGMRLTGAGTTTGNYGLLVAYHSEVNISRKMLLANWDETGDACIGVYEHSHLDIYDSPDASNYISGTNCYDGIEVQDNSSFDGTYTRMTGTSSSVGVGIRLRGNSTFDGSFSQATTFDYGAYIEQSSSAVLSNGSFNSNGSGLLARFGSFARIDFATASSNTTFGFRAAYGSFLYGDSATANNNGSFGFYADYSSGISANSTTTNDGYSPDNTSGNYGSYIRR